ncbi:hypothetical protein [Streptomyces sp. NPDC006971]|uniref:hypothetical protein n=1 Tax=Streptomyces sp. NPDC006971 TaxID=3154784 RepID=UPI0033D3AF06
MAYLRDRLIQAGVLPPADRQLLLFQRWLAEKLPAIDDAGHRRLSPGPRAAQPMTPETLELRLRRLASPTRRGSTAAIRHLVLQPPAPVIVRMLDHHDDTTAQLTAEAGGTWRYYAPGNPSRSP